MKKQIIFAIVWLSTTLVSFAQVTQAPLPFKYNALEPYIDSVTMNIHFNNHHAAYVANLNKAIEKAPQLKGKSIEQILLNLSKLPVDVQTAVRNNGGGHYNHTFFWSILTSPDKSKMSPALEELITKTYGSVDKFKSTFESQALSRFGSGWVWLVKGDDGKLKMFTTANQDNSIMDVIKVPGKPVLALDVWEHAYYLKYQSKRAEYVKSFWKVVNWDMVEKLIGIEKK
ncbi:MAG TPA: superoxide dismutase [Paludibacter sp.]|nr:superoxide dismutase [Paludibacter sp.]